MRILSFSLHSGTGQPSHSRKQQLMSASKVCDFATNKSASILSLYAMLQKRCYDRIQTN